MKETFLDIALVQVMLGMEGGKWILEPTQTVVNRGAITEAFKKFQFYER